MPCGWAGKLQGKVSNPHPLSIDPARLWEDSSEGVLPGEKGKENGIRVLAVQPQESPEGPIRERASAEQLATMTHIVGILCLSVPGPCKGQRTNVRPSDTPANHSNESSLCAIGLHVLEETSRAQAQRLGGIVRCDDIQGPQKWARTHARRGDPTCPSAGQWRGPSWCES